MRTKSAISGLASETRFTGSALFRRMDFPATTRSTPISSVACDAYPAAHESAQSGANSMNNEMVNDMRPESMVRVPGFFDCSFVAMRPFLLNNLVAQGFFGQLVALDLLD